MREVEKLHTVHTQHLQVLELLVAGVHIIRQHLQIGRGMREANKW